MTASKVIVKKNKLNEHNDHTTSTRRKKLEEDGKIREGQLHTWRSRKIPTTNSNDFYEQTLQ
jgi:hypothetical protein